ncbi:biotin--[acetyl-CoA-carboxylase] ligase [Desulfobacula sp.]|uniref:biotin--[acetyl-CoA-carboxylase] ligase n=1 Tax=Desulfobacula sp. TaxID=2593537 RepID=UPI00262F9E18|nr:biotin--[acetyl-CoA-carboxylase] ligase [Desulfobacula sp.]
MVNELKNIKEEILKILYTAKGKIISGVRLSDALNVSRVAVWKHIKTLKERGFDIESRPKGYVLLNHDDLLLPFCFNKEFEKKTFHFQELETTMDKAKILAKNDAPHLSVVIAENQTTGRGRLNRKWFSSKGGLWFTLILKPNTPPVLSYIYNFAASLSLSKSLRQLFDVNVSVKWPNDILLNGQKLVGLLSEMETRGDMVEFINIGIGINVNNSPREYEPKAISLKDVLHKNVSRRLILETFLDDFKNRIQPPIQTISCHQIIEQWKEQTSTIGSQVRIETTETVIKGLAVDVDETGALMIKDKTGEIKKIIYGDCFHT